MRKIVRFTVAIQTKKALVRVTLNEFGHLTVLLGTGSSDKILSKIGWQPCFTASVSVKSGRTVKQVNMSCKLF